MPFSQYTQWIEISHNGRPYKARYCPNFLNLPEGQDVARHFEIKSPKSYRSIFERVGVGVLYTPQGLRAKILELIKAEKL